MSLGEQTRMTGVDLTDNRSVLGSGGRKPANAWLVALAVYFGTTLVVYGAILAPIAAPPAGGVMSPQYVPPSGNRIVDALTAWDAQWYLDIAENGYTYEPERQSAVAFFPAYPLLVRAVRAVFPLSFRGAGLLVSHAMFVGALALLRIYSQKRFPAASPGLSAYTMIALALFPSSFFMRMAYTESLFLFLCLAVFVGMECRWPLGVLALMVGATTAARSVGVAMLAPLAMYVYEQSGCWRRAAGRLVWLGPLAVWGLAAYILFQWYAFDAPLAFAKTQHFWRMRPPRPVGETLLALGSWEPIWSVYLRGTYCYWREIDRGLPLALSYHSANCVAFVGAAALLLVGGLKGWLARRELVLGALLLAIPYVLASYRFCMGSQARYVSVVFPIYVVLGQFLCRIPRAAALAVLACFGGYLAWFSAMLSAGYVTV